MKLRIRNGKIIVNFVNEKGAMDFKIFNILKNEKITEALLRVKKEVEKYA